MNGPNGQSRLGVLRRLLTDGEATTQEELRDALKAAGFDVTQSTISRDLKKIDAVKATDAKGRTIYRLIEATSAPVTISGTLTDLVIDINHNNSTIVIRTTPGSASLVARHLDAVKPAGILGTIAGDDTIFVAPGPKMSMENTIKAILESFS